MGNIMSLPAPNDLDTKSKQFLRSPDSCQVYVFPKDDQSAARVYLDDVYFGDLATGDSFLHFSLAPGNRRVRFESAVSKMQDGTSFACEVESLHFVRFRYSDAPANPTRVLLRDERRGQLEVRNRWRADLKRSYELVPATILGDGELLAFREGDAFSLYQYDQEGRATSFGTSPDGGPCGVLSAIVDYGLTPAGGLDSLHLLNRKGTRVQLAAVCNAKGRCELPSLIGPCRVEAVDTIEFVIPSANEEELLIIEPAERRPYVNDVYFGSAAKLAERATCDGWTCKLDLDVLRTGSPGKRGN